MMRKWMLWMMVIGFFVLGSVRVSASNASDLEEGAIDIEIPDTISEYLPFDFSEMNAQEIQNTFDFRFFSEFGIQVLAKAIPEATKDFALLLGLFLVSSILHAMKDTLALPTLKTAMDMVSLLCMATAIFEITEWIFGFADGYIEHLSSFLHHVTPTMAAFMAASGKLTSASVISGVILLAVSLLETVASGVLFPLVKLSLCLSVVSSIFGIAGLNGISVYLRKMIAYVLGFITLSLSAVLTFQNLIAKSTDSMAIRGIKFAIGNFVPFVGGAVNEALATVLGGIGAIKAATGVVGAVVVALLAAAPVIRFLVYKMFLEFLSFVAGLLGLGNEMRFMTEVSSFFGYTAAIMAMTGVFFVLALSMMASA